MRKIRIIGLALILAASAMSLFAGLVLAATAEVVDPSTIDLALLLTAGGIPIASAIVSSVLSLMTRIPGVSGHESVISMGIDAVLIALAFSQSGATITVVSVFFTFMAWVNLALATSAMYDKVLKPAGVSAALAGSPATG